MASQVAEIKPSTDNKATVAVVGAGIIGICTALYLQRNGYKVTIIDSEGISNGCSKGSAGHFATEQVFPLADKALLPQLPIMLLDPTGPFRIKASYLFKAMPWFLRFLANMRTKKVNKHIRALRGLNERALAAYEPLIVQANLRHLIINQGSLLTFEKNCAKKAKNQLAHYQSQGVNVELISKQALKQLEPNLSDSIECALLFKDVGHSCDPEALAIQLAQHFMEQGGDFVQNTVEQIKTTSSGLRLKLKQDIFEFNKVVVATGAWSKSLMEPLGYKLPIEAERGYHLMVNQHNLISRPVTSADRKFIMTPMSGGLRLAGTVEFAGLNAKMNDKRAEALWPHAKAMLPSLKQSNINQKAKWMLLTSARVKGKEAFEIGLADFLVPQSELMSKAEELAKEINAAGPLGVQAIRETVKGDSVEKIEEIVKWELSEQNRLRETADFQEGIKASLERRDPEFTGN